MLGLLVKPAKRKFLEPQQSKLDKLASFVYITLITTKRVITPQYTIIWEPFYAACSYEKL